MSLLGVNVGKAPVHNPVNFPQTEKAEKMAKRFLLDGNIIDKFLENPNLLALVHAAQDRGLIELISTHVEFDELEAAKTKKPEKGELLVSTHVELEATSVDTDGFVLGISRLDMATFMSEEGDAIYAQLTANNPNHAEDALLILTAKREGAAFVSEETDRVPSMCRLASVELFNAKTFGDWCQFAQD